MTNATRAHARKLAAAAATQGRRRRERRATIIWIAVPVALVAAVATFVVASSGGGPVAEPHAAGSVAPPTATGTAAAGDLEVHGARIAYGTVPMDTVITPAWRVTNTGDEPIALPAPHVDVVEGCCPGEAAWDDASLAPGASTTLEFPLEMHEGMGGPHDFRLHLDHAGETLELQVTALFA